MATKSELTAGLEFLIQESKRLAGSLSEADWAKAEDMDGWKNTQVLAHVAGVGTIVVPFLTAMGNAPAGADTTGGTDINALNATLVGQREGKSPAELAEEVEKGYRGVIEFVRTAPPDLLERHATAGGHKDLPISDLMMRMVVLHGLGHVYSAYAAVFNNP